MFILFTSEIFHNLSTQTMGKFFDNHQLPFRFCHFLTQAIMDNILDKLLEKTKFSNNSIKICFLPQKVGLGYTYVPIKKLELCKTIIKKPKRKTISQKKDSEDENMEYMIRRKRSNK